MRSAAFVIVIAGVLSVAGTSREQEIVYEPGGGVTLPKVVREVRPQYPPEVMQSGVQGTVTLRCVVQRDGKPGCQLSQRIHHSSPSIRPDPIL